MAECAPGSAGCVEFTYDFGPNIHHELRHCVDRAVASEVVGPRDLIPVAAFDDEVYAKGCLKGRTCVQGSIRLKQPRGIFLYDVCTRSYLRGRLRSCDRL